ncbi:origin recognition complex subunit 5 C-terminus-domain-containing protein [Radiomyces spectabilis]|uniref:origin recognition complex subunit 5 C-terminus-domain-containing protein n=1 Tax=Radiomyces spectabilis TaxID=64574 RepID=UPI00221F233D|nr:origin recognition complex subunit 5 C-terminus-domain-containing protein [Radiomyces spectabilis]KAI8393755.1 origin recognition complex subunit 5 C-terminus-domain-containing protein [Radiomyces spectabilis]
MSDQQDTENDLQTRFPGRAKQINTLLSLIGQPTDAVVPSIFVYGCPSSGKTSVVRAVLEKTLKRTSWAFVNCIECHSPRMVFEHAMNQWCDWTPSWNNQFTGVCRIDSIHQFVQVIQEGHMYKDQDDQQETRYLILDRAERLRDMSSTVLPALLRLSELARRNICVILISSIVFEKFRMKGGVYEPLLIRFPDYTKEDTLQILELDFAASGRRIPILREKDMDDSSDSDNDNNDENPSSSTSTSLSPSPQEYLELDVAFFRDYVDIIYSVFNHNCKDLNEIRYFAALLFPLYLKPIQQGRAQKHEKAKLLNLARPYIAEASEKLYLREISSAEWTKATEQLDTKTTATSFLQNSRNGNRADFDLPYYTKFLLLASYLASYNPPKFDVRYFSRTAEERRKKKGGGVRKGTVDKLGGKMRQQLLGPKPFPVERMLAIFYSIIGETLEDNIDIQLQITSLTTLRLLVRSTKMDRLDGAKYQCNVSFEFIRSVAKSVRFEIDKYLYDFT